MTSTAIVEYDEEYRQDLLEFNYNQIQEFLMSGFRPIMVSKQNMIKKIKKLKVKKATKDCTICYEGFN